ncbi:hypothetical protein MYAM1_003629 [Malassezia yamatoensis]|uniref:Uncharacterized protein n=1 Tax=Malassezia yamatoensis TaxID=253288 RepID=A0AAJ6CJL0_9BASI|nr:hypothetical protein MYAM1_003629 [Malassezia yamatoensis]
MSWVSRSRAWYRARRPRMSYFRLFKDADRTDWILVSVGTVAAIAAGVPLPVIGVFFGKMLDQFNQASCQSNTGTQYTKHFLDVVAQHVIQIVAVAAANFVLVWIYTSCWSTFGERVVRRLRESYVRSLLSQDKEFFDSLPSGAVNTHLTADLLAVQNGTSEKVGILLASLAYFVASYVVAFWMLPVLAAQLVSLVPALMLVSLVGAHFGSLFSARASKDLAEATGLASEIMTHLRVVQAFEALKPLQLVYNSHLHRARRSGYYRALSAAVMLGCLFFVAYSANALAFHSGARMVTDRMNDPNQDASETVGAVYTVIFLLLDASFVVGQIAPYLQTFSAAGGAGGRLFEVTNHTPTIDISSNAGEPLPDSLLGFRLDNVHFAYPTRQEACVLDGVTLDIPPGQRVGICGTSGSGKSTVAALLHRFYDPTEGKVTLHNDLCLKDVNLASLRAQIGYVGQDAVLSDCTVLENIAHGLLDSPKHEHLQESLFYLSRHALHQPLEPDWQQSVQDEHKSALIEICQLVKQAAQAAHADRFIDALPNAYRTRVGHAAHTLSGGQKQRIALARAIVKQPKVLLLDEATAALDSHSELSVQAALDDMETPRTTIAIAHRLATIQNYDKIIVMAHGRVVEQGTHAELLSQQGYYAQLAAAQYDEGAHSGTGSNGSQSPTTPSLPQTNSRTQPETGGIYDDAMEVPMGPVQPTGLVAGENAQVPQIGNQSVLEDERSSVSGPPAELVPQLSHHQTLLRLARFSSPSWIFWLVGLAASAAIGGAYSGEAVLFGHVVQALNPCQSASRVESQADLFALFFFIMAIIELFAYFLSGASLGWVAESLLQRVRVKIVEVLASQRLNWYESRHATPSLLIADLIADTSNLGGLTGTIIGTIFSILVNLVAGIVLAHAVAWRIAIVILATVPIILLAGYLRLKVLAEFQQRHETVYAKSTAIAVNAARDIETVAALRREKDVLQLFQYALDEPYRESLRYIVIGNVCLAVSLSISYFIYGFAYWWGSRNVAEHRYSQVAFFTVLPALLFSAQTSGQLLAFGPDLSKAQVSAGNLFSILEHTKVPEEHQAVHDDSIIANCTEDQRSGRYTTSLDPSFADGEKSRLDQSPEKCNSRMNNDIEANLPGNESMTKSREVTTVSSAPAPVQFHDVTFTYAQRTEPALRNVSFSAPAGAFVALIGESGSGKSTCLNLIENLYTPDSGWIRVGGQLTSCTPTAELRRSVSIVPQDAMLFHGSVAFNVALGLDPLLSSGIVKESHRSSDTPKEVDIRIKQACIEANIHDAIVAMPNGYWTDVGPGGTHLSGGQRQRLAIARALVRRPRLLLLDEPTSAMDANSEQAFQSTLEDLQRSHSCTIITVAHRMRTIRMADEILLFSHGKLTSRGSHDELLQSCAAYRMMVSHQSMDPNPASR